MTIKALIPARAGSQRVINKNIRDFCGSNLLAIKIQQLKSIGMLDGVVVNSENDGILKIARDNGAEIVKRPAEYASSSVSINEVYKNIAENFDADIMVYCNCTNPLIKTSTVEDCIKAFLNMDKTEYGSLNTGHLIKEFMWLDGKPVNYSITDMPRSQDLPNILALNFAVNINMTADVIRSRQIVSNRPFIYTISQEEALDIDNEIDFKIGEAVYGGL